MADTDYRRGLMFRSPYSLFQYVVRPTKNIYSVDGTVIDTIPELVAEWGMSAGEYSYEDTDGVTQVAAEIRGNFFNLDVQAEEKGWSDDDRALVALVLLKNQPKFAGDYQLHSVAPVPAPWPTYDSTHHNAVPTTAVATGLVAEALAYERQGKNRESVVEKLEEELVRAQVADDLVAV